MRSLLSILAATSALIAPACAQTYTSCDPLNTTCSPNPGLAAWTYTADFTGSDAASLFNESWTAAEGTSVTFGDNGMVFNISKEGEAPTVSSNL